MAYDGDGNWVLKLVRGTAPKAEVYCGDDIVFSGDTANTPLAYLSIKSPYGIEGRVQAGGGWLFYEKDHLGSTRQIIAEDGRVVEQDPVHRPR